MSVRILSPELLTFRDFMREPPGVWLWSGGPAPFARVSDQTYRALAASGPFPGRRDPAQVEALGAHGILLEADALDEHTERVAAALGLIAEQSLPEAAIEFRRARRAAPALTATWLEEAFTWLRAGAIRPSRLLLDEYRARWPGDPAAAALLRALDQGPVTAAQRGHVMVLAPSATIAHEVAARADSFAARIAALCGSPPNPAVLVHVTDSLEAGGRCLRGGSPFARLVELTSAGVDDATLLAHEVVHALVSSGNLAFAEGLALFVSAMLSGTSADALSDVLAGLSDTEALDPELADLFLDLDAQPGAFERTAQEAARADGGMPRAHWLAFLGVTALVSRVGLAPLVDFLRWLRDPTPAAALATQEQLFALHFGSSLRAALRAPNRPSIQGHAPH